MNWLGESQSRPEIWPIAMSLSHRPSLHCMQSLKLFRETHVLLAAQNLFWEAKGAFTGEISPEMLKSVGCSHVIIGHSERRQYFGETDETVAKRVQAAADNGLTPIVCGWRESGAARSWASPGYHCGSARRWIAPKRSCCYRKDHRCLRARVGNWHGSGCDSRTGPKKFTPSSA